MEWILNVAKYGFGFLIGFIVAYKIFRVRKNSEVRLTHKSAYCFQCEFEMPVLEKDGEQYCSNCGLYHYTNER